MKQNITELIQSEKELTFQEKGKAVLRLSAPGMLAQITEILMQYIDAAMVGALGANAAASIGLVSSSTWLFYGLLSSMAAGFSVQVAHAIGANNPLKARNIFRKGLVVCISGSLVIMLIGIFVGQYLPSILHADPTIHKDAIAYFTAFCLFLPVRELNVLSTQMLQCEGNMKTPSILMALSCVLDVIFNFLLIFPTRTITLFGSSFTMYGMGLGVLGAQLGTAFSVLVSMIFMAYHACIKSKQLSLKQEKGEWKPTTEVLSKAVKIGLPMAFEQSALTLAQIVSTRIVAPLGNIAIAANSFAVTAESICYMPGYGIGSAATTLVGQSIGARKKDLARSFAWLTTVMGMLTMTLIACVMYFLCPYVFAFLTPVKEVQELGVSILRIELLAEPMFAASIVATGALRGAGDTLIPGIMNLLSIWGVRIVLAFFLTQTMGLRGVWIAMCIELNIRGLLFLIRLKREAWLRI